MKKKKLLLDHVMPTWHGHLFCLCLPVCLCAQRRQVQTGVPRRQGWFAAIALLSLFALNAIGCSSMGIAKQKKGAMLMGRQIEFVGDQAVTKCNDGTLEPDDCDAIADTINLALDAQNAYVRALVAMQSGAGSQEQVQKALEALQNEMSDLISDAVAFGLRFKEK